jgi:hypothetical protein
MCMGDLTPVPWRYSHYETGDLGFFDGNFPRTCRSFDKLRAWVDQRNFNESISVKTVYKSDWLERARESYRIYAKDEH